MSEPSSPLLGHAPKWPLQPSRSMANAKYTVKIVVLAFVCILLGASVSVLYKGEEANRPPAPYWDEYTDHPPNVKGHYPSEYVAQHHSSDGEARPQNSFYHHIANKIDSLGLNPWRHKPTDVTDANETTDLDQEYSYLALDSASPPIIGKVTMLTGKPVPVYERAIRTHDRHNAIHGYSMYILRQIILESVWSKPAYILSVLLREMAKPPHLRLHWLVWVDADTIIINPNVPLEIFLPPETPEWDDVNLLVTHDWNGLNNGVFPIRVCEWSVELLSANVAWQTFKPDVPLQFRDQSALEHLLDMPHFRRHTVQVPQRWFNAYQGELDGTVAPHQTRPGDLLVHFAGVGDREAAMTRWLDRTDEHRPEFEVDFVYTTHGAETRDFWRDEARRREESAHQSGLIKAEWERRKEAIKIGMDRYAEDIGQATLDGLTAPMQEIEKLFSAGEYTFHPEALKEILEEKCKAFKPVQDALHDHTRATTAEALDLLYKTELVVFTLDLSELHASAASDQFGSLEESMRRLQTAMQTRLITEEQMRGMMTEVMDLQTSLETAIAELSGKDFNFKDRLAEAERKKKAKARPQQGVPEGTEGEELRKIEDVQADETLEFPPEEVGAIVKDEEDAAEARKQDEARKHEKAQPAKAPSWKPLRASRLATWEKIKNKMAKAGAGLDIVTATTNGEEWIYDDAKFSAWRNTHAGAAEVPDER